jgi:hypothetical protein
MKSILFGLLFSMSFHGSMLEHKAAPKCSIKIWDYNYSMSYTMFYDITDDSLIIKKLNGVKGEKDTVLVKRLLTGDERRLFSDCFPFLNIDSLKNEYNNPLVEDGDRKRIVIQLDNKASKTIDVANYYQRDLAILFNRVNRIVPPELKITYTSNNK